MVCEGLNPRHPTQETGFLNEKSGFDQQNLGQKSGFYLSPKIATMTIE